MACTVFHDLFSWHLGKRHVPFSKPRLYRSDRGTGQVILERRRYKRQLFLNRRNNRPVLPRSRIKSPKILFFSRIHWSQGEQPQDSIRVTSAGQNMGEYYTGEQMQRPTERKNPPATKKAAAPRFDPRTSSKLSPNTDSAACVAGNKSPNVWDCGSPLYDSYEVVSFFYQLDKGLTTPPPAGIDQITSSNRDGMQENPANPTLPPKSVLENVNSKPESKKPKKHRFRRFFQWAFNISRMLVLRASAKKCPRHRSLKADSDRKCAGDSVPQS